MIVRWLAEAVDLFVAVSSLIGLVELLRFLQRRDRRFAARWPQALLFGGSAGILAIVLVISRGGSDAADLGLYVVLLAMVSGWEGALIGGVLIAIALPQLALITLLTVAASALLVYRKRSPVFALPAAWAGSAILLLLGGTLRFPPIDILWTVLCALGIWMYVTEVDHRRLDLSQAEERATTDPLTGILNRSGLSKYLVDQRDGALIAIDLDDFKSVNELYGHTSGDVLLQEVARRLRSALRPEDRLARIGGDEFVAAVSGADVSLASSLAARMEDALADGDIAIPDGAVPVRASFGVATGDLQVLFAKADAALLQAKADGKGRIRVYGEAHSRDAQEGQLLRITSSIRDVLSGLEEGVVVVGPSRRIVWTSPNYGAIAGVAQADAAGRKPHELYGTELTDKALLHDIPRALEAEGLWRGELVNRRPTGELWWADWSMCRIAVHGRSLGYLGFVRDATPSHRNAAQALASAIYTVAQRQDPWIQGHIERTGCYMDLLVRAHQAEYGRQTLPLNPEEYRLAASLHDVGKMFVPTSVLLKRGPLTRAERTAMNRHAEAGYAYLRELCEHWCPETRSDYFRMLLHGAMEISLHHHERWDGNGYPHCLAGPDIPAAARLFSVIDVYDALCSERPHKDPWPEEAAFAYLEERSGSAFDPAAVDLLARVRAHAAWKDVTAPRTA